MDGSGPLLAGGAAAGRLMHSAGSTDVLAVCVDQPMPTDGLLCRPLGVGKLWVLAATQAAGSAGLAWARRTLFTECDDAAFNGHIRKAAEQVTGVVFSPHLAGDRQGVDQPTGGFSNLTLATTRDDLLAAVVQGLVDDHRQRLDRLLAVAGPVDADVLVTGGGGALPDLLRREWPKRPGGWSLREVSQGTLRGVGAVIN